MHIVRKAGIFSLALLLAGCAHGPKLPPASHVTFAGKSAQYHDYARVPFCEVDGQQVAEEMASVNVLLTAFVKLASRDPKASWTKDDLAQLRHGGKVLPKVTDIQDSNIEQLSRCPDMQPGLLLLNTAQRGRKLVDEVRKLMPSVPGILATHGYAHELAVWKAAQAKAVPQAQKTWCPAKPRPGHMPDIYYALADVHGQVTWMFCDGSKVQGPSGGKLKFVPSEGWLQAHQRRRRRRRRKLFGQKDFIEATSRYPADQIQHPPPREDAPASAQR